MKTILSSAAKKVEINRHLPTVMIGERINPTGRKSVLAALQQGDFSSVRQDALDQVAAGARLLDINAGVPGADEPALLARVMTEVMAVTDVPLCIDTANLQALERALALYPGKALINSVSGEQKSLDTVLPLAKKYGAAVIGLCMDDGGIPATPEDRVAVGEKILQQAGRWGIPPEEVILDPLAMTMGADCQAGRVTLETIAMLVQAFRVNITLGASNISFGLPDRKYINAAFIAMAIQVGLSCPITNPLAVEVSTAVLAADLALGRDEDSLGWIRAYRRREKARTAAAQAASQPFTPGFASA